MPDDVTDPAPPVRPSHPPSLEAQAHLRTLELCAEVSLLFRNLDALAKVSPKGARVVLRSIAEKLAGHSEGSA